MVTRATGLNPRVLAWARERSGLTAEEAAAAAGRPVSALQAWESGDAHPTWNQLESLAKLYRRPVALFFFPEPPAERDAESEFRSLGNLRGDELLPDTRLAVREGRAWQQSLRELAGAANPSGRFILRDIAVPADGPVEQLASAVRDYLGVPLQEQQRWPTTAQAFKNWRRAVENAGVFVFKRSFEQNDVSGFCLHDPQFPVIVINNSTAHSRQIFTLFHELAHLLFRVNGITQEGASETAGAGSDPVEVACDRFAHEFLVPAEGFPWDELRNARDLPHAVAAVADRYNVSRLVVLRKARDHGEVDRATYRALAAVLNRDYLARRAGEGGGGSYYANQATYLGDAYLRLAFDQFHSGRISLPELAQHLDVKARNVGKLEDFLLARQ